MNAEVFWNNVSSRMGYMRWFDMAKAVGIKKQTLSSMRIRHVFPRVDTALKIAASLKCSLDDLFKEGGEA